MPELPEVETIRRGIAPHLLGRTVSRVVVRDSRLRWPVASDLAQRLVGQTLAAVDRRAKYLLLRFGRGTLLLHMGMSGTLMLGSEPRLPGPHDHLDIEFGDGAYLRLRDPRRFGSVLWTTEDPHAHPRLAHLGVEPLDGALTGDYLYEHARGRQVSVKHFLMDARVVVGIGNIYANEALFLAGIDPRRSAARVGRVRCARLAQAIRDVLGQAIAKGGTTLRDFRDSAGRPGYFEQHLRVYGRADLSCVRCGGKLRRIRQGQRSTVFCPGCQH
jgi:formamidopyrimidine-DNA glycosylase